MVKLAFQYMRFYKSQAAAILASVVCSAALFFGVSSLMYSSQRNDLEHSKEVYGSWHFSFPAGQGFQKPSVGGEGGDGFALAQCGEKTVWDVMQADAQLTLAFADEDYLQMAGRSLLEGRYPKSADEVAADSYTLGNLGYSTTIGERLRLGGKDYVLTGIVKGEWDSSADELEAFVGKGPDMAGGVRYLYLRFEEGKKLYLQLDAFLRQYGISQDAVSSNDEVVKYLGGERPDSIFEIVRFALTDEHGNFTYLVLKLQSEYHLAYYGLLCLLCVFCLFVIYSIFQISVSKRVSEYGILKALGIDGKTIGGTLLAELWSLLFLGYPLGCLLGFCLLRFFNRHLAGLFAGRADPGAGRFYAGAAPALEGGRMYVAWGAAGACFLFLTAALALVAFLTVRSLNKRQLRQVMGGDLSFAKGRRRMESLRHVSLTDVLARKFMFSNRRKVAGILLSLSVGGCLFLSVTYLVENLSIHAEMALKSEDGLGFPYKVSIKSSRLSDVLPESAVEEIRGIRGLSKVYASKYLLGELSVSKEDLEWREYFDEVNANSYFQERFGGICVDKGDGVLGIKYDVYGYDEGMVGQLEDFLLEGEIDPEEMEREGQVIAVALMDGQGNYHFYGKHPGDTVRLRVPRDRSCPEEALRFEGEAGQYTEKEFRIAAIVSRSLSKETQFLNVGGWDQMQSLIFTDRQMETEFGVTDYSFLDASPSPGEDAARISGALLETLRDVPKAALKDVTSAIEARKKYLRQQQMFYTGMAAILFVISLLHMVNSVSHSILSRRREYGLLQAMGITDAMFYRMIVKTGLVYGLLADLLMFGIYHLILRRAMDYYMAHVAQFLHFTAQVGAKAMALVMGLNLFAAVAAVLIPARRLIKGSRLGRPSSYLYP